MKTDQEKAYEWFLKRAVTMPGAKEMYKTAVEALSCRIGKKPESKNYHFGGMFLPACPTCGEFLTDEDYCPKCGQAIEWGEYDDES